MLTDKTEKCCCCNGSGWVVRDPDIGTDQECFACGGSGVIEAEVRAESQEPVATKLETQAFSCFHVSAEDAERLKALPVGTQLFATPQPPASCPKCADFNMAYRMKCDEETKGLQAKIADLESELSRERDRNVSLHTVRRELMTKVAEQSAEIERLTSELNVSVEQTRYLMKDQAVKFALIEELESDLVAMTECAKNHDAARTKYLIELGDADILIEKFELAMRSNNYDRMSETLVAIAERNKV